MFRFAITGAALVLGAGCIELGAEADHDVPALLPGVAPAPCDTRAERFAIDGIELPRNPRELDEMGFDLDGDPRGRIDNSVGALLALIEIGGGEVAGQAGIEELAWTLVVERCDEVDADHARVTLTAPGRTGAVAAVGAVIDGEVRAADGAAVVPLGLFFAGDAAAAPGYGLALTTALTADGDRLAGRIGFAVSPDDVVGAAADPRVTALAVPDVDLMAWYRDREVYWPRRDGRLDRMSFGFRVRATRIR